MRVHRVAELCRNNAFTTGMHAVKSFTNARLGFNRHAVLYPLKHDCFIVYKSFTTVVLVNLFTACMPAILDC